MAKRQKKTVKALKQDKWNERYLIKYIKDRKKEAKDASKHLRTAWRELWLLYQNKQDYSKKLKFQSKVFVPKLWMKVNRAAAEVKRAVLQTSKLFKLGLDDEQEWSDDDRQAIKERMTKVEKRFKCKFGKTNFANIYSEMVKVATLLGLGVPKVLWKNGKANFENIDILNLFIDPTYKPNQDEPPGYMIETKMMKLAELRKIARETNRVADSEVFNLAEIDKIEEEFKKVEQEGRERERRGLSQYNIGNKEVQIDEFWGNVISEDGKDIKEHQLMMLANERYLIRKQDNPFNHGLPPYILTLMLVYPHRGVAGESLVQPTVKLQYTYNNIINLYMDNLNFSVNKCFEYNPLNLSSPQTLTSLYPGKLIATTANEQVLREVFTSSVGPEAIAALDTVGKEIDEGTAVTEFIEGRPGKRAKTLGEVQLKTAESRGLFDIIARDLEQNSIKPLLEMTYSLYEQFGDFETIDGIFVFLVGGLSLMVLQSQQRREIGEVLSFALGSSELAQRTDIDDLWRKFLSVFNLSDVYIEPEERERPEMTPEQEDDIVHKAEADAKAEVAKMSREQIQELAE